MTSYTTVTPTNQNLFSLVHEAGDGKLSLPQFQRSFVWSPEDVKELLLSVFKQYFIGSLLVMEIVPHSPPFSLRAVEGLEIDEKSLIGVSSRLLLDGQQRITSLYYAFYAPDIPLKGRRKNSTMFFINLQKLFEGNVDDAIFYKSKDKCESDELQRGEWQFRNLIVSLPELLHWSEWSGAYAVWLANENVERLAEWTKEYKPIWDKTVNSIFSFTTSVLTLSKIDENNSNQLEEICTVFEKLNSTGVTLTVFDLLTARLYPKGVYLDSLWNEAVDNNEIFSQFQIDKSSFGVLILRCIALMRGVDLKSKALINLSHVNFNRDWRRAVEYFDKSYARLTSLQEDGFGVFDEKWLPYTTIIPVLAALLAQRDSLDDSKKADATQAIRWWYWGAVFTERFTGPVETVTQRDYNELTKYFEDHDDYPEVFQNVYREILRNDAGYTVLQVARRSTLYKAIMCLLALNGARDFRVNESITFSQLEDHHIFPKSYLKVNYVKASLSGNLTTLRNTIVNRTLISGDTNRSISNKPPNEYLVDDTIISQDKRIEILRRHFIDDECEQALMQNEYEIFLLQRESVIIQRVQSLFSEMPRQRSVERSS